MEIPNKLKLISVAGPVTAKNGKEYCFANAETPSDGVCAFSTIRWRCVRQCISLPTTWKVGAEVPVQILEFKARDGEGSFDVPATR